MTGAGVRAAACLSVLAIAGAAAVGCAAPRLRHPETLPHFHSMVPTDDGWEVAVYRVPAAPGTEDQPHHGTPLLMAHGTGVNRMNFLLVGSDLAAYLASRGFDVWLTEYRGDRTSRAPTPRDRRRGDWDLDDVVAHDVPAVIDHVRSVSGRDQLYWIGHSLGGIVGYVTLQTEAGQHVAGMVAVGSPGAFVHPNDIALFSVRHRRLLPARGQVPIRPLTQLLRPLLVCQPDAYLLHVIFNAENADPRRLRGFVGPGMENAGRGLIQQFAGWVEGGPLISADGSVDYTAGLARIQVPMLFLAGRIDHVVPAWTVRLAHDLVGSTDRTFVVFGEGWGTRFDYGHGDLLVGDHVHEEVFPLIADWLERRAVGPPIVTGDPD